jgi:HK97 gp10 family phage protein
MAIANPWTVHLRVNEVQKLIHEAASTAVQEVFELDIVPEAKRLSPVSPDNPKIVGSKYKDTGHNRRSIDATVEDTPNGPAAELFTQSGYGGYLEVGTSKMPARPYLYPAFQKFIGKLGEIISAKLKTLG